MTVDIGTQRPVVGASGHAPVDRPADGRYGDVGELLGGEAAGGAGDSGKHAMRLSGLRAGLTDGVAGG